MDKVTQLKVSLTLCALLSSTATGRYTTGISQSCHFRVTRRARQNSPVSNSPIPSLQNGASPHSLKTALSMGGTTLDCPLCVGFVDGAIRLRPSRSSARTSVCRGQTAAIRLNCSNRLCGNISTQRLNARWLFSTRCVLSLPTGRRVRLTKSRLSTTLKILTTVRVWFPSPASCLSSTMTFGLTHRQNISGSLQEEKCGFAERISSPAPDSMLMTPALQPPSTPPMTLRPAVAMLLMVAR